MTASNRQHENSFIEDGGKCLKPGSARPLLFYSGVTSTGCRQCGEDEMKQQVKQQMSQLKITVCISLVVTLFFAFRAEAEDMAFSTQWVKAGVSATALKNALSYDQSSKIITNKEWLMIADYTMPSSQQRLFIINLKTGLLIKTYVAHGIGSDDGHGNAVRFSNQENSLQTSSGFLKIGEHIVSPGYGAAFRLEGLEDRNSQVKKRLIILHGANYVSAEAGGKVGLSEGCPAVSEEMIKLLYSKNIPGSLFYGYTPEDAPVAK